MDQIIIGVDTHKSNPFAVAIDDAGRSSGNSDHPGDARRATPIWNVGVAALGSVKAFGIEGTGSFGAGLSRVLAGPRA